MDESPKGTEIVRYSDAHATPGSQGALVAGIVWCVMGGIATAYTPAIGAFMVAYGMTLVLSTQDPRRPALALITSTVAAFVTCRIANESSMLSALAIVTASYVMGAAVSRDRVTMTRNYLLAIGVSAVILASDAALAWNAGTTLPSLMAETFDASVASLSSSGVEVQGQFESMRNLILLFWPMNYLMSGAAAVALAHFGARQAWKKVGRPSAHPFTLARFDMPLWPVVVLIAGIALLALSGSGVATGDILLMVGANLIMGIRFAFAFQGLAVIDGLFAKRGASRTACVLAVVVGIVLEVMLAFAGIVGLVDVWANFRRIPRGKDASSSGAATA